MNNVKAASGSARLILIFVGLGLLVMLVVSLSQRLANPHLIIQSQGDGGGGMAQQGGGMSPEVGRLMQQIAENPNDLKALVHLTEHLVNDQQWEPAETFARRAVVVAPGESQPQYLLGVVLHNRGKNEEAAEALERVITLKDEASVRYSLGILYIYYLNNTAEGGEQLSAALHVEEAPTALKPAIRAE